MKFRVTFLDNVDLLIEADKEIDAVRKARELKDKLSASIGDGHETELRLLPSLESVVKKVEQWKAKHESLKDILGNNWSNWSGLTNLRNDNPAKYERLTKVLVIANEESKKIVDEWNSILNSVSRGSEDYGWSRSLSQFTLNNEQSFPQSRVYPPTCIFELFRKVKDVLKEGGTGAKGFNPKDEDYGKYSNEKKVNDASQKTILDGDYIFIGQEPTGEVFIQLHGDPIYDDEKSKFSNFLREVEKVKKYF